MLEAYEIGISLALQDGVSAGIALIRRDLDALDRAITATSQNLSRLQAQAGVPVPLRPMPASRAEPPRPGPAQSAEPAGSGPMQPATSGPKQPPSVTAQAWPAPTTARPAQGRLDPAPTAPPTVASAAQPARERAEKGPVPAITRPEPAMAMPPQAASPAPPPAPPRIAATTSPQAAPVPPAGRENTRVVPTRRHPVLEAAATPVRPQQRAAEKEPTHSTPPAPATLPVAVAPEPPHAQRPAHGAEPHRPHATGMHPHDATRHPPRRAAQPGEPASPRRATHSTPQPVPPPSLRVPPMGHAAPPVRPTIPDPRLPLPASPPPSAASVPAAATAQRPGAPPPPQPQQLTLSGDILLDGTLLGRWIADSLARQATRPPAGPTGPDPRQTPLWSGQAQGF